MNLDEMIKYENENTFLDFKESQYKKEQHESLIKDVMSMANAHVKEDKFIIIGVRYKPSGERELLGIDKDTFIDSAIYQQLIKSNIEPDIDIDYFKYEYEGKYFGIFQIKNCINRPYMMKKDYNTLKKGNGFIRKGSQQGSLGRNDLEIIYQERNKISNFDGKIQISFGNDRIYTEIELKGFDNVELPSKVAENSIINIIKQKREVPQTDTANNRSYWEKLLGATGYPVPYEMRTIEELEDILKDINDIYKEEDAFYFYEQNSNKINLTIFNQGDRYIEDASIKMIIKKTDGLYVANNIYEEPSKSVLLLRKIKMPSLSVLNYPSVEINDSNIIVKQVIGNIKHHMPTKAFDEPLRIVTLSNLVNNIIELNCKLYAKNLRTPFEQLLKIRVIK